MSELRKYIVQRVHGLERVKYWHSYAIGWTLDRDSAQVFEGEFTGVGWSKDDQPIYLNEIEPSHAERFIKDYNERIGTPDQSISSRDITLLEAYRALIISEIEQSKEMPESTDNQEVKMGKYGVILELNNEIDECEYCRYGNLEGNKEPCFSCEDRIGNGFYYKPE